MEHSHTLTGKHNRTVNLFRSVSLLALAGLVACSSSTQQSPRDGFGPPNEAERRGPPPEAYAACESLAEGNSCDIQTPRETLSGTCRPDRQGQSLLCVPTNDVVRRDERGDGPAGGQGQPPMREHKVVQSNGVSNLYPAIVPPITDSRYESQIEGEWRIIKANSISEHNTGQFPNPENPNSISVQSFDIRVPANPVKTETATRVKVLGYGLNGVSFDPGAGEFYKGNPSLGWQYEALSGAVPLGIDENHAHVQPTGKYHYHGIPTGLVKRLGVQPGIHSPQIGWAVDGFPIYALYGHRNLDDTKSITELTSSYRIKSGMRPSSNGQPGGAYDGTYTADYDFTNGSGDLDECNGRMAITPDFPNGTYAYFLTQNYPVVPRCVMGTPDPQAQRH